VRATLFALVAASIAMAPLAASAATSPASPDASRAPPTALAGITVTAPRPPPAPQISDRAVHDFVRAHGAATRIGQLARWREPICAQTFGLPPEFNAFVSRRIAEVGVSVGAPAARAGPCVANISVFFTTRAQAFMDHVRSKRPELLGYHYHAQAARLATFDRPIQAWYVTATQGANGETQVDDSCCGMPGGTPGSSFGAGLASEFSGVMIVADWTKVAGYEVGAIADYIAVLALSHAKSLEACGTAPSIADLISTVCDRARPQAITDDDVAYLKALYGINPRLFLSTQQGAVADRMKRNLADR
jgi:hypothetical protein